MKRLILDHYRRWIWVLLCCVVLEFFIGMFIAGNPLIFEFYTMLTALWTGGTLLSFDLKRGLLRTIATLPLTGRQIGRACWLAAVPIPAVILTVLLFAGAATFYHINPERPLAIRPLVMASLFTLAWLGINFTMVFNGTRGFGDNGWEFIRNAVINWFAILVFFGSMVLCHGAAKDPLRAGLILGAGALLTVLGWRRAEQFEPGRAGIYLGRIEPPKIGPGPRLTPLERKTPPGMDRAPAGYSGLPFLLRTACFRASMQALGTAILMILLFQFQGLIRTQDSANSSLRMVTVMSCLFLIFFQLMPLQMHLRFLRTLPISTTRLALTMFAVTLLPIAALGGVIMVFAGLRLGPAAALSVSQTTTFILALAALFVASRAIGVIGSAAFLLGEFLLYDKISLSTAVLIALATTFVAFIFTRHALSHSKRPYRIASDFSGSLPWAGGR